MNESELTPDSERVELLRDQVPHGPVVMLNLLKFREPDGRKRMEDYSALTGPLIARQGGELFYMGAVGPVLAGESDEPWDICAMIRFPDIEAFIGMGADPEYQEKAPALRAATLERTLWLVTQPLGE